LYDLFIGRSINIYGFSPRATDCQTMRCDSWNYARVWPD